MTLSDLELERYSRQLVLPEWSGAAQARLRTANAIVVGVGALGSPVATYLAAAGVGTVGLVDSGTVELSNLHRQPLHFTPDLDKPKTATAANSTRNGELASSGLLRSLPRFCMGISLFSSL